MGNPTAPLDVWQRSSWRRARCLVLLSSSTLQLMDEVDVYSFDLGRHLQEECVEDIISRPKLAKSQDTDGRLHFFIVTSSFHKHTL